MRSLLDTNTAPTITPRQYQLDDTEACMTAWRTVQRVLAVLPTGAGKTVMAGHLSHRHHDEYGGRTLFLAHREELIRQTCEKFAAVWPGSDVGIVKAAEDDCLADVVVASIATVVNPRRLQRVLAGRPIGLVIADEAHHIKAASWETVIKAAGCFDDGGPHLLGLTATPARGDGKGLDTFEEVVVERDIRWGIAHRHLVDIRAIRIQLAMDLDTVKRTHGDFSDGDLSRALHDADGPAHIVEAFLEHAADRRAICFVPTVEMAEEVAEAFRDAGVNAEHVIGEHGTEHRLDLYRRLRAGDLRVLCSVMVLSEGFDEPSVDCIIAARPTAMAGLYIQQVGRGLRPFPGKRDCLVLDVVGVTKRHRMRVAADLLGADKRAMDESERLGIGIGEAMAREAAETPTTGVLVAEEVDLWAEFDQAPVAWSTNGQGSFLVSLGTGRWLRLRQEDDRWTVAALSRDDTRAPYAQRTLGSFADMGLAQGFAEAQATQLAGPLAVKDAVWRSRPASEKQLDALRRMRIPAPPGLTAGDASALMTAKFARNVR